MGENPKTEAARLSLYDMLILSIAGRSQAAKPTPSNLLGTRLRPTKQRGKAPGFGDRTDILSDHFPGSLGMDGTFPTHLPHRTPGPPRNLQGGHAACRQQ